MVEHTQASTLERAVVIVKQGLLRNGESKVRQNGKRIFGLPRGLQVPVGF